MSWKFDYNKDDSNTSEFNEAFLKIRRFHELQDQINKARVNPLMFNQVAQIYNFEMWFQNINSLLMEVFADLEDVERIEAEAIRKGIQEHLYKNPIYQKKKNVQSGGELKVDHSSWRVLEEFLTKYESLVRTLIASHGYGTKYNNDEITL